MYAVTVDYSKALHEMVAAGKYDVVHSLITEQYFPVNKIGIEQKTLVLVPVLYWQGTRECIELLNQQGLQPATLYELLAWGAQYPDEARSGKYIIALGNIRDHNGVLLAPAICRGLYWSDDHRPVCLHMYPLGYGVHMDIEMFLLGVRR